MYFLMIWNPFCMDNITFKYFDKKRYHHIIATNGISTVRSRLKLNSHMFKLRLWWLKKVLIFKLK